MMLAIIIDNNSICRYELNKDIQYKGINIYEKNGKYYIDLKTGYYFNDNSKSKILEVKRYDINIADKLNNICIYVYETNEGINEYSLYKTIPFIIASDKSANIVSNDQYLKDYYLSYSNGYIKSNYEVFVNHTKYNNSPLKSGDMVEYLGIKFFYFEDFIYINNFNIVVKIPKYDVFYANIKYKAITTKDTYYLPENIEKLSLEDIKAYEPIKKPNNIDFIKSIIPNLIMCLSMGLMAYINYISNIAKTNNSIVSYIIMPISMFLTGIFLPLIFVLISNREYKNNYRTNRINYLKYLDNYETELKENIIKYINSLNSHYFNLINSKNMMFYASKKSIDYLKLSVGKITTSGNIKYQFTEDEEINAKITSIIKQVKNIKGYPIYLDIKNNYRVTIVSKSVDKQYYFYKFLLEASYKHHYEDISIAAYSKDSNVFNMFYNLPHLFINSKRLTLSNKQDLQMLDQLPLERPLILFAYDKVDYEFTNKYIHTIYFSTDISDCLKDSDLVIEYFNNFGYTYDGNKTKFEYIPEDIDFYSHFMHIGRFKLLENSSNSININNIFNFNVLNNYEYDNHSLTASFSYNENNLISFDLHESRQGPHGLIGGSTGSGKSELIVSLLLSLALRYPPDYLNIVLIDYKGGGIKESLSYNNISIPHIVASLTNLNDYGLQRLIIALNNECKRRQLLFKKLSNISNVSIMNIDDYIDNNNSLEKISHLLIVVDEFAELKKNNPEQIKELISISRIGRSLGVHLILATQKPAGVIDDEIWSNSRFKIALKVFDEKDSADIIKSKEAAFLGRPGSFYMLVDGGLVKGDAIYTKNDIYGNDPYKISLLNENLDIVKTYKKANNKTLSSASYYCKKIIDKTKGQYQPYLIDFLPPVNKDRHRLTSSKCLSLGEIDDYINGKKGLLAYSIKDSLLIYSSRAHEINAILNTLNENKRHSIVIANDIYEGKYISDSITYDNNEDIDYLFNYLLHNRNNNLTLVIEDINCLLSYDETYIDKLAKLIKRKDNLDLSIICLTSNSQISFKLINLFKNKIMININDNSELSYFYGSKGQYIGKSYFYFDSPITFIPILIETFISQKPIIKKIIKSIPEKIEPTIYQNKYLLGYDTYTKDPVYIHDVTIISYNNDLIDLYKRSYIGIKTILYKNNTRINDDENILWLGPGIFNQRLFVTGAKEDIKEDQGILIVNNKKTIIRSLYNA